MLRKNCTQTEMERVKASKFFFSIVFAVGISFQHTYYVHVGKKCWHAHTFRLTLPQNKGIAILASAAAENIGQKFATEFFS